MTPWLILLLVAVALEVWGYLDGVRVVTLSRVIWGLRERWPWLAVLVGVFFVGLWWHWFG